MQRILIALVTLACFPAAAGAGWDVEFAFEEALPAPTTDEPITASDSGNPLVIDWNIRGVEDVGKDERIRDISTHSYLVESTREISPYSYLVVSQRFVSRSDSEANRDVVRITAGTWPLTPRYDEKSVPTGFPHAISDSLWPLTRRLFWPLEPLGC